jgi:hypothetical protein
MSADVPIDLRRARRDLAKRGVRATPAWSGLHSTDAAGDPVLGRLALWLADVACEAVPVPPEPTPPDAPRHSAFGPSGPSYGRPEAVPR